MKDISRIMQMTCKTSFLKIMVIYLLLFTIQMLIGIGEGNLLVESYLFLLLPILLGCIAITYIHIDRFRKMSADGAFTRIMLLPCKRSSLLWSELLFTTASYAGILFVQNLTWILLYLFYHSVLPPYESRFLLYTLSDFRTNIMFAYSWGVLLKIMLMIGALSMTITFYCAAFTLKVKQINALACLFITTLCIVFSISSLTMVFWIGYALIIVYGYIHLRSLLGIRRRCQS